jgi:hypothetical protein
MPTLVTISSITGDSPYEVYLCTSGATACYYIDQIETGDLPYSFTPPVPLQDMVHYCVKAVDNVGCIITLCKDV